MLAETRCCGRHVVGTLRMSLVKFVLSFCCYSCPCYFFAFTITHCGTLSAVCQWAHGYYLPLFLQPAYRLLYTHVVDVSCFLQTGTISGKVRHRGTDSVAVLETSIRKFQIRCVAYLCVELNHCVIFASRTLNLFKF